ncbi:MAG TPA: hypothetical protein DIC45_13865 [Comamonadaceae bacterium]|uniref:cysteine-rich CWC family protein n=1 Tax=Pulveribacter sp. TaxID=2678893 RepID=UPI000EEB6FB0|nr:cysteine-rich CWC family protein [Pulveribacter sp.]HCL87544.1 hypothetical protein [Comamonadaceae bacterium]
MPAIDTTLCPLCGQANACAMAAGLPAADCWCMAAPVSRAALARVPEPQRGKRCICPHCAREVSAVPAAAADKIPPSSPPL